jgi:hypothetical protein
MVITAALIEPALPGAKCIVTDHRELKFRNKTVFGLFTVTVTNSVAVFLVCTRFENGFLCDFYYKTTIFQSN